MKVTINSALMPVADEICTMYAEMIFILHHSDDMQDAIRRIEEHRAKNLMTFMQYFTYNIDDDGIHIFQRRLSNPEEIYSRELFIIS